MRSGSINARKELNKEDSFSILTPIMAFLNVIGGMVNSNVDKDEYTKGDFANMAKEAGVNNSDEIASMLSKPLKIEQNMLEKKAEKIMGIGKTMQILINKLERGE